MDSNVLLDVSTEDPYWGAWSKAALDAAYSSTRLVINPIIYAEVSVRYPDTAALDGVLPSSVYGREDLTFEAAFFAGKAHLLYRRRGGERRSPLSDFFIGAHAAVAGYRLLTRDAARYRTYFPGIDIIAPDRQ